MTPSEVITYVIAAFGMSLGLALLSQLAKGR